jgi:Integrase zinc binding domain/Integrase core domain
MHIQKYIDGTLNLNTIGKFHKRILERHEFVNDEHGLIYMLHASHGQPSDPKEPNIRLVVPLSLQSHVQSLAHSHLLSGHAGVTRSYQRLIEIVWWPSMLRSVYLYIQGCVVCQQRKTTQLPIRHTQPMRTPSGPWQMVGIDTVGPLPTTERGNKYLVVMIDYFTRMVEVDVLQEQTAEEVLRVFMKNVVCRHGVPQYLLSDKGSPYMSELAQQMYNKIGIHRLHTTAYHPQTNGAVERINGVIKGTLRIWANDALTNWDLMYPFAVFSINTAYHSTLQYTPFFLNYMRQPVMPLDIAMGRESQIWDNYDTYVIAMSQLIFRTHKDVTAIWEKVNKDREEVLEKHPPSVEYEQGEKVWLRDDTIKNKLMPKWLGPYEVTKKCSSIVYELLVGKHKKMVNIDRMKRSFNHEQTATRTTLDCERDIGHFRNLMTASKRIVEEAELQQANINIQLEKIAAEAASMPVYRTSSGAEWQPGTAVVETVYDMTKISRHPPLLPTPSSVVIAHPVNGPQSAAASSNVARAVSQYAKPRAPKQLLPPELATYGANRLRPERQQVQYIFSLTGCFSADNL